MPQNMASLEYELLSRIFRMTMETKPTVVLMAPYDISRQDPRMQEYMRRMGQDVPDKEDRYKRIAEILQRENYNVIRTEMTESDPLPQDYDLLIVMSCLRQNFTRMFINELSIDGGGANINRNTIISL